MNKKSGTIISTSIEILLRFLHYEMTNKKLPIYSTGKNPDLDYGHLENVKMYEDISSLQTCPLSSILATITAIQRETETVRMVTESNRL